MTTNEINATHNHLFRGEFATELVAAIRERINAQPQRKRRTIAVIHTEDGEGAMITAPTVPVSDPAVAKWIADGAPTCGSQWSGDYRNVEPAENRAGYIGE